MSTYLRRRGRITRGQARALDAWEDRLVVPEQADGPLNWAERFGRQAPLGVEIGFGMGHALLDWAASEPDMNLVGVDVYRPGIGALLSGREERELVNVQVVEGDARIVMERHFSSGSLAEIRIFFPDPWPKKRHHKRRLISTPFVAVLADRLAPGGRLRLATDWEDYADWMLSVLESEPALTNEAEGGFSERFAQRTVTRFEARGHRLGHAVWDLSFTKNAPV